MRLRQGSNPSAPQFIAEDLCCLPQLGEHGASQPSTSFLWVHFQRECSPKGKMQDGNIYLRTVEKQDLHMRLKGQGCSSHPPLQEPLLKMATDCAQLMLAVSHLEIPVPRFNLKTIIHHCFTHSRYFSLLKAQVNKQTESFQTYSLDSSALPNLFIWKPQKQLCSWSQLRCSCYPFPNLNNNGKTDTGLPPLSYSRRNAEQLKLTLSIYMMPNNNTNTNLTRTSETSLLHK